MYIYTNIKTRRGKVAKRVRMLVTIKLVKGIQDSQGIVISNLHARKVILNKRRNLGHNGLHILVADGIRR